MIAAQALEKHMELMTELSHLANDSINCVYTMQTE